ncbi:ATP-grasp fold amidoligase family protein [Vibrio astriarenae]
MDLRKILRAAKGLEKTDIELSRNFYVYVKKNAPKDSDIYVRAVNGVAYVNRRVNGRLFDDSFNHKVQRRIDKGGNYLYSLCSDKHLVREYVKSRIGDRYLIPLLAVIDKKDGYLLNKDKVNCFLKPNNAAGRYLFVGDKALSNKEVEDINQRVNDWLEKPFGSERLEAHYLDITPKVLIEKSIASPSGLPVDYKFHMFKQISGDFKFVLQIIKDRGADEGAIHHFFDNNLDNDIDRTYVMTDGELKCLPDCLELSKCLMDNFDYARIDWYVVGKAIYFGEITFTPGAGLTRSIPLDLQQKMANYWQLSPKF